MQRVVSGEDIHGLPTKYSSSDLQQQLLLLQQHQTLETSSATITTTSPEPFDTSTSTNNNVTSSISDDAMSLEPFVFVVGSAADGSAAVAEAANVVENDSGDANDDTCNSSDNDVMMDVPNTNTSSSSSTTEYSTERYQQQQQQQQPQQQQQQLHPRLSVLSPLLPIGAGHSSHIPRTDSRNSATTFSSQGRQGSQNSSRDWGWFEDMHHSDHGHGNVVSDGTGAGTAVVQQQQQQQQQQQRNCKNINNINNTVISGTTSSSDSNIKYERMIRTARNNNNNDINENNNNNNNNNNIRPSIIDTATTRASLLPTGNEMIIDDMQEYLEPILVHPRSRDMENEAAVQAVTAPNYVLEESLSDQFLWKNTAGNRPPQPVEERAFFEAMWAENFSRSEVAYQMPKEVLTATTPVFLSPFADGNFGCTSATSGTGNSNYNLVNITASAADTGVGGGGKQDVVEEALVSRLNDPSRGGIHSFVVPGMNGSGSVRGQQPPHLQNNQHRVVKSTSGSSGDLTVFTKGDNVFGTTVSKSFARPSVNGDLVTAVDTVNISVASYRVVESEKRGKHAQFLVIYREGSIRDTIGVWKRYSDFQELSNKVTKVHEGCTAVIANMSPLAVTEEHDVEHLPNAITSWHLLKKRKRWYRCLDPGYLSLKVFLLERFLHDILFESSSPDLLRDFVGVPPPK